MNNPYSQTSEDPKFPDSKRTLPKPKRTHNFPMPQYDVYEDPLPTKSPETSAAQVHSHNDTSTSKPLSKIQEGVSFDPNYHIENHGNPHSAMEFHRRHSHLERHNSQLINSTTAIEPDSALSPKKLTDKEKLQLRAMQRSQQEDDEIRMTNDSEGHAEEEKSEEVPEFDKETHMLNGGWMHRSRGSCELLRERQNY